MSANTFITLAGKKYGVNLEPVGTAHRVTSNTGNVAFTLSSRLLPDGEKIEFTDPSGSGEKLLLWVSNILIYKDPYTLLKGNSIYKNALSLIHDAIRITVISKSPANGNLVKMFYTKASGNKQTRLAIIPPQGPQGYELTNKDAFSILEI